MSSAVHNTVPVQVWVDIDTGVSDLVVYLNTIPGVRTHSCCQGTIGEGGPEPYRPYVSVTWSDETALRRLLSEFDFTSGGPNWGCIRPRESLTQ
jgi:hypothetical protein